MKKLIIAIFTLAASLTFATSWNVSVTSDGAMVVPNPTIQGAIAWSAKTYFQGDYVLANGRVYWTPNGGASTIEPDHSGGIVTETDTVQWLRINHKSPWKYVWISGDLSVETTFNVGTPAVAGVGYILDGARSRMHMPEGLNSPIYANVASGTAVINVMVFK